MAAIAALFFLAVCAYMGAGIFKKLRPEMLTVEAELFTLSESSQLHGIAVRQEEALILPQGAELLADDNQKYASGDTLFVYRDGTAFSALSSVLFLDNHDGLEYLSPQMLLPFDEAKFHALSKVSEESLRRCAGRLISDDYWFFAAEITQGIIPEKGSRCKIEFRSVDGLYDALVWAQDGDCVLLRLNTSSKDLLSLRKCEAQLIFREHRGLKIPQDALRRNREGNFYVEVFSSGLVEKRSVDIIYTGDGFCLVQQSSRPNDLHAGETIIVSEDKGVFSG